MKTDIHKKKRHDLIREIIQTKPVGTQSELVQEIRNRDMNVTQTTISRDLEELCVGKWNGKYRIPFSDSEKPTWVELLRPLIMKVERAGDYMIVVKTKPSSAVIVEKILNDADLIEVAGVIASQATVMLAFSNPENLEKILNRFISR